jgi:predicted house-cleaning noncanonical NTP pyrophosphatase (MazG superfamily)
MFLEPINQLSENLKALRAFVKVISPLLLENIICYEPIIKEIRDKIPEFIINSQNEQNINKLTSDEPLKINVIKDDESKYININFSVSGLRKNLNEISEAIIHYQLLYNSSLMSLISFTEWFLSQILHDYFEKFPDVADISEKTITFQDLRDIGTIEDARRYLIESKIESILWGDFEDWLKLFKDKFKLSLSYIEENKPMLIEVFQRRNILVHNGGRVNSIYIAKVAAEFRKDLSIGDMVNIKPQYLERSINLFERSFIILAAELWKKLAPSDDNRARLNTIAFDHLCAENWEVAESLSYFIMSDKKLPEKDRLIGTMNYWQCIKWQGRFEEIRGHIEETDFSAKDEIFVLAQFALLDKNKEFFNLVPRLLESNKITHDDLSLWPIFREIRKDPIYLNYQQ